MNVLFETINRINSQLIEIPQKLTAISDKELSLKPAPEKWSKKEILGHLCDSAYINLGRFIRAQIEQEPFVLDSYDQDNWVRVNNYRSINIKDIINIWTGLNQRLLQVVSIMPEDKLATEVEHNGAVYSEPKGNKNVLWLFEDYLAHMEHHLRQLEIKNKN